MIEYIQLRNFQSHKEIEMELHPGVNVIIGESDSGKTAIMRALYWLTFGKPAGDSMRRHGTKRDTEVTIETESHQISRIRGNSTNEYVLTTFNENNNEQVFKGFGQSVPQPIIDVLNLNEINFMRQLDPPFLFSKTAGEIAQYLNRLINLDIIDSSLLNIKRMHTQASQSANHHLTEIQHLEKALEDFAWTEDAERDVSKIEKKQATLDRMKSGAYELNQILDIVFDHEQLVRKFQYTKRLTQYVEQLYTEHKNIEEDKNHYAALRNAVSLTLQTKGILAATPTIKGAEKALLALEKRVARLQASRDTYKIIDQAIEQWADKKNDVKLILAEHRRSMAQLKQAMPEMCPLCDQPIRS